MESSSSGTPEHSPLEAFADPRSVAAILWAGRKWIAGCVLVCLACSVLYLAFATRLYLATAKFLVLQHGGLPLASGRSETSRLIEGAEDYIPTHAMIVSSPVVLRRAIESIGLRNLGIVDAKADLDQVARAVAENLSVTRPDRMANILQIGYRSRTPQAAVQVVDAVANSYQKFLEEVYAKDNSEVVMLMSKARDDLNRELKDLERKYLEFRQKTPHLTGDGSGRPFVNQRIDEWNRAARDAMVKGVQLEAQLELGRELAKQGVGLWSIAYAIDQVAGPSGNGLATRTQAFGPAPPADYLRQLASEQQQLVDKLGPQSTKVKEIQEQITQAQVQSRKTRGQLEQAEIDDLLASIERSLASISSMRAEIQKNFEMEMIDAKRAETDLQLESNLKNELERHRTLFHTVVDQLKQARLVGDYSSTHSQVIEAPNAAPDPVRPLVMLTILTALAAGCVLGIGAALGAELIDPRVRSLADVRRVLRLPVLGRVPFVTESLAPRNGTLGFICHAMPHSPSAEAYRVVRANLDLARRSREARVLMVTSPRDSEGKSTVASNLAVALAQAGRRVLLVDADLRSPALHKTFGLSRDRGLVHLLRDLVPPARVVKPTKVKNLDFVASGPEVSNPAELLSTPALAELLARVGEGYDTVVVDAPSLLRVADASILGAVVDGIVLIVRMTSTKRADAARAIDTLDGLGTPVLGVVVNGTASDAAHQPRFASAARGLTRSLTTEIPYDPQMNFAHAATNRNGDLDRSQSVEGNGR